MSERTLYISTGAFKAEDLSQALRLADAWGFPDIELSSGVPYRPDNLDVVARNRSRFRFLAHNYFPAPENPFVLNLAAADPDILARSRAHCRAALELTVDLGAPFYAAHAGFMMQPAPDRLGRAFGDLPLTPRPVALATFRDSVGELLLHARRLGVNFYIENNVVPPFNAPGGRNERSLMAEPDEMIAFACEMNDPGFGFLLDAAHLKVSARTLGFDADTAMAAVKPWIRAFHLSDNDGTADTNQPFGPDAWFLPWLRACPGTDVVVEVSRAERTEIQACADLVRTWMAPAHD